MMSSEEDIIICQGKKKENISNTTVTVINGIYFI